MICYIPTDENGECMYCHGTKVCSDCDGTRTRFDHDGKQEECSICNNGRCLCTIGVVIFFDSREEDLDQEKPLPKQDLYAEDLVRSLRSGLYRRNGPTLL